MVNDFQNLLGYKKRNLYYITKNRKTQKKNIGYRYNKTLVKNSVSGYILRNTVVSSFVTLITDYLINVINNIKHLEKYKNFTVDKEDIHV